MNLAKENKLLSFISKYDKFIKISLLYFFVFEIQLKCLPTLFSSRKLVLFTVILYIVFYKRKQLIGIISSFVTKYIKIILMALIFLCFYTSILVIINQSNGRYILNLLVFTSLYVCIAPIFFSCIFKNKNEFIKCYILVCLFETVTIVLQQTSQIYREIADAIFLNESNYSYLYIGRAQGLGASGASITLILFLGMLSCSYMIFYRKHKLFYYISFMWLMFSSLMCGMTGTIFGILLLIYTIFNDLHINNIKRILSICLIFLIAAIIFLLICNFILPELYIRIIEKWKNVFSFNSESSISILFGMDIPRLSIRTFFGTGITRGTVGDISCYHDSGYIRSYFSMGIIGSLLFYGSFYYSMIKDIISCHDKKVKIILTILFLVIIISEAKEPFIMQYFMPFYFFTLYLLSKKGSITV